MIPPFPLQMAHTPYRNVLDCARKMAQAEGISAFYKSYRTTLVRGGGVPHNPR